MTDHVDTVPLTPGERVERTLNRLLAAASVDAGLRRRLLADPVAVLAWAGLRVEPGVRVTVAEVAPSGAAAVIARSTDGHVFLPLPPLQDGVLADDQLDAVAGGLSPGAGPSFAFPFGAVDCVLKNVGVSAASRG